MKHTPTVMDEWLKSKENDLKSRGYRRYVQNFKSEDFAYWKTFFDKDRKAYQVGILFYDFRKYTYRFHEANQISMTYECLLTGDTRIELTVSNPNMTFEEFEKMSLDFYQAMSKYQTFEPPQPLDWDTLQV